MKDFPRYCELAHLGAIGFSGPDAQEFLHNQLTCDVAALAPDRSVYGSYCTPKGRVLATFLLWRTTAGYFMQLPLSLRESVQKRLTMYVLRSKVKVEDASGLWLKLGIADGDAAALVERVVGTAPAEHRVVHGANAAALRLPPDRFEILVAPEWAQTVRATLKERAQPAGADYWDWLEIRAGVPAITQPTQEQFVPQMLNLDLIGALSFSKGCYPGQEIVARMHFRGRLKSRMYLARLEPAAGAPRPGDKLYSADLAGQSSGMIVNAAPASDGAFDTLAVIQQSSADSQSVHWKTPDGPALRLLSLPYEVTRDP